MNIKLFVIMIISNICLSKPLAIAHRGASAYAPENTLSSIEKAYELGVKFIEIDVHMTSDRKIVAIHDSSINRTSNAKGSVYSYTLNELKKFDFGSWFDLSFSGEKIPSLESILKTLPKDKVLIIEFKYGNDTYPGIEDKAVALIKSLEVEKNVILKSFDEKILKHFKNIAPEIQNLYCTFGGNSWITFDNFIRFKDIMKEEYDYIQVHKFFLKKSLIKRAHENNVKVVVWDVNSKESMEKFIKLGVDLIETDHPDYLEAI